MNLSAWESLYNHRPQVMYHAVTVLSQGEPLVLKELRCALTQRAHGQLGKDL